MDSIAWILGKLLADLLGELMSKEKRLGGQHVGEDRITFLKLGETTSGLYHLKCTPTTALRGFRLGARRAVVSYG